MGYTYLGLGGLVRTTTKDIFNIVEEVRRLIPKEVRVHLFGIARPNSLNQFLNLGVNSIDSASLLRRAWMGTGHNYLTLDGQFFTAIRIPQSDKSFRAKRIVSEGRATKKQLETLENDSLNLLRKFDQGKSSIAEVLDTLCAYDEIISEKRQDIRPLLKEVLENQPWKHCPCQICKKDGIEVIIFRGNNRNRRRGFHNTYVFYRMLQKVIETGEIDFIKERNQVDSAQMEMNFN